jgi:hypothetical protein
MFKKFSSHNASDDDSDQMTCWYCYLEIILNKFCYNPHNSNASTFLIHINLFHSDTFPSLQVANS